MNLCILWHMHQPFYKNLITGRYEMPWVRLHSTKDYYDMVAILDEFPAVKQTFNLVPSLLEQIEEYGRGEAIDDHLELSRKDVSELTDSDKAEMLVYFFKANYETMIKPHPRFDQLYKLRRQGAEYFSEEDWRDLQVWSNLVWIDPMFKKEKPIKNLLTRGKEFSEKDKSSLLEFQQKIISGIIPKYKEVAERGQIELSVTPYFHPILPLLVDTEIARQSVAQIALPENRFRRTEDARLQVKSAIDYFESRFGFRPKGMWPSEGSVSEQIVPLLVEQGIQWIATDEEILAMSLGKGVRGGGDDSLITTGELYQPYRITVEGKSINIFFRDHAISDLIGFVYSKFDPQEAAVDLIGKLEAIEGNLKRKGRVGTVCIALDGENAWEYFPDDGRPFLSALYKRLSEHPTIKTVTFSEAMAQSPEIGSLKRLHPGSWINHNFNIWIGHREDNKAWDLLFAAREELAKKTSEIGLEHPDHKLALAMKEILVAEGSDWCWWFGDEHHSPDNDRFDQLYRSHLMNVYELLGLRPPAELQKPIRTDYIRSHLTEPIDYLKPTLDGKITHYYEWASAGFFDCRKAGSTMHKADRKLSAIYYGYGRRGEVFFRIDPATSTDFQKIVLKFEFTKPEGMEIVFKDGRLHSSGPTKYMNFGLTSILEIEILVDEIGGDSSAVSVHVLEGDNEVEKWPVIDSIPIRPDIAQKLFWAI